MADLGVESAVELVQQEIQSPIGSLILIEQDGALITLAFGHRWAFAETYLRRYYGTLPTRLGRCRNAESVERYFCGELSALSTIKWSVQGTVFQQMVWRNLVEIVTGKTVSYLSLAQQIGRPRAVRAVANAVGANPLAIVLPCHRVMGSDGSLTGFGGGLDKKRWLLCHEGVDV